MNFRIDNVLGATVVSMLGATSLHAYEVDTHQRLSDQATQSANIYTDPSRLQELGMPSRDSVAFPLTTGGLGNLNTAVMVGSAREDTAYSVAVFNHFFDPQYNNFAGRGMQVLGVIGHPSPNWAIEDLGEVGDLTIPRAQDFSIRNMQQYFYNSLVAGTSQQRLTNFALALESAGHAIHHIQDMAQPQHARNDQHLALPSEPAWGFFERYSSDVLTSTRITQLRLAANYPVPAFPTSREYWHTPSVTSVRYAGMSEFSSNNFVSHGKNFQASWSGAGNVLILPHPELPRPNGSNFDGTPKFIETQNVSIALNGGGIRSGNMDFVIGKVYDPVFGGMIANQRQAAVSVLDMVAAGASYSAVSGRANVFTVNSAVFDHQHDVLIPRAIAFSAGLLNHLFRGRLDLARGSNSGSWVITNLSGSVANGQAIPHAINGVVSLYYDDGQNIRRPIPGANSMTVNLQYGQSIQMGSLEPPSGATRVIAVFAGRIGAEGDPSGSGFFATAGKVITFSVPTIPCGQAFAAAGSSEGKTQYMDLGSTAGRVQGEFEAYYITDSMVIRRSSSSGPILFSTGGLVSGYHPFEFDHPGGSDSVGNRIWIKVTGNSNTATLWHAAASCPGQPLTNADRIKKRINISFSVSSGNSDPNCGRGTFDVYVDAKREGRMNWGAVGGDSLTGIQVTEGERHSLRLVKATTTPVSPYAFNCVLTRPYLHVNGSARDISAHINSELSIAIP